MHINTRVIFLPGEVEIATGFEAVVVEDVFTFDILSFVVDDSTAWFWADVFTFIHNKVYLDMKKGLNKKMVMRGFFFLEHSIKITNDRV